uniref:SSNA1 protein n=1 Tax=Malurus cyaneus samueli TaxID=2593467 RepID=A0A8C5U458_9PASS
PTSQGLSELRGRREELSGRIRVEEAERVRLQARIAVLSRRLANTSESLAGLRSTRAHIDRTIAEMDAASGQVLTASGAEGAWCVQPAGEEGTHRSVQLPREENRDSSDLWDRTRGNHGIRIS